MGGGIEPRAEVVEKRNLIPDEMRVWIRHIDHVIREFAKFLLSANHADFVVGGNAVFPARRTANFERLEVTIPTCILQVHLEHLTDILVDLCRYTG